MEKIHATNNIAALPYLLPFIHHPSEKNRDFAERIVAQLLPQLDASQITALESLIRESWSTFNHDGHKFLALSTEGWKLSTLAASGWRREKAVAKLASSKDSEALPYVLLRLNDWVPQVQAAAHQWFSSCSDFIDIRQIIQCAPILAALTERGRGQSSPWVQTLIERLAAPEISPLLLSALPSSGTRSRQLIFSQLAKGGSLKNSELQQALLTHADPMLGVLLLKHLHTKDSELPDHLLLRAITSRRSLLRRYAWHRFSERQLSQATELLTKALFDPTSSMRTFAQYYLSKDISSEELQSRYAEALKILSSSNQMIAISILGFHESKGQWLTDDYLPWLNHSSVRVRASALRCFATAHFDQSLPWLKKEMLNVSSPTLGKLATALLQRRPYALTMDIITSMLSSEESDVVRLRAFQLLCKRGKWEQLPCLLQLTRDSSESLRHKAVSRLSVWLKDYNRSQIQPTPKQIQQAVTELCKSKPVMSLALHLEFHSLLSSLLPR
ncbi:hypothetical protein [Prosthecobacter algae]|uniref:HEAT repeat domain-containing protein n=1 Tax=Prosthecobacter algae TaxID=1144682 RepID=UPI0031EA8895